MFIKKLMVNNFRLFSSNSNFELNDFNIPDGVNKGSGLTIIVGENGCGKTTLLDAIALPLLSYKTENVCINDFGDPNEKIYIEVLSCNDFTVAGTMPKSFFESKGFSFEARLRKRDIKSYLSSSIVTDQKYIKSGNKPDDNSPDLRVNVNNPFKGIRFNENDILFLDKNRVFQTRFGTYNSTRFDRLMENFDFQYIKECIEDLDEKLYEAKRNVENSFLNEAMIKFEEISGKKITLNLINNYKPFHKSFFAEKKSNYQQIPINMLGSGYEMIFSLVYAFCLSKQSNKKLIVLIDEPELHLHPSLQEKFADLLLDLSESAQIILTSHSPLLVKQLFYNQNIKIKIICKDKEIVKELNYKNKILPYISANEINYLSFGLATTEYHNELYGYIQEKEKKYKDIDVDNFLELKGVNKNKIWIRSNNGCHGSEKKVTLQTYIRHSIHHPENDFNTRYSPEELSKSIKEMIDILSKNLCENNSV